MSGRLSANDRREQLLTVALRAFASAGYHDTSMNEVAEAAGVTKPVLYQHFQSKRDLYQAVLDEVGAEMVTSFKAATDMVPTGKDKTRVGFHAYFRWVADHRDAFKLLFGTGARQDQEFAATVRRYTDASARAIAPLIDAGIDQEHQLTLAHAIVGMSESASRRLVELDGPFDPDLVADQLSQLAWAGLRGLGQPTVAD